MYDDAEERKNEALQQSKCGNYDNPENGCPNCGRSRIMLGDDSKHRCEKCYWCIEDKQTDIDLSVYLR